MFPGTAANVSQIDGPRPSAVVDPSTWNAEVAAPKTNAAGNVIGCAGGAHADGAGAERGGDGHGLGGRGPGGRGGGGGRGRGVGALVGRACRQGAQGDEAAAEPRTVRRSTGTSHVRVADRGRSGMSLLLVERWGD